MGRERKLTDLQIAFVIRAYKTGDKAKGLAEDLGVSVRTVQRILKETGINRKRGRRKDEHYAALVRFTKEHPDDALPRNMAAIATRVGCSPAAVKAYLYRVRRDLRRRAVGLDFYHPPRKYVDIRGRTIPSKAIESYTIRIESWTNVVRLDCVLKGGAGRTAIRLPAKLIARLSSKV